MDDIKLAGKKHNIDPMWKVLDKRSWFGRTNIFPGSCILGMHSKTLRNKQRYCGQLQNHVRIANFSGRSREITIHSKSSYFFMVLWHGWSCKEVCGTILWVGKQDDSATLQSIYSMHRWPPLQRGRNKICWRIVKYMLSNCFEIFLLGTYWTTRYSMFSEQTRTIHNKMDQGLWQRLNRLISCIHHTNEYKQYCHVGNTAKQCRLGLFQDSDFAGGLEGSGSSSGGTLCFRQSHICPISWMCKKQTAVFHSSTASEIISLDTGLRLDGLPAVELWDLIVSVFRHISHISDRTGKPENGEDKHHKSHNKIDAMKDIDAVPSDVQSARQEALLYVFEDNEAVIEMIMKGRSPTMRHVSRTHRVALDWLLDRINMDPQIQIKYIDTKNQLADILTKGNFTRDEWNHLLTLFNISHFSSTACIAAMAKRAQQSQVTTHDEFDRKNAFVRVFFSLIKPGEDLVWISRSWKIFSKWR